MDNYKEWKWSIGEAYEKSHKESQPKVISDEVTSIALQEGLEFSANLEK